MVLIAVAWFIVVKGDCEEIFAGARLRAIAICLIVGAFVTMFAVLIAYLYRRWDAGIAERSREAERVKLSALYEAQSSLAAIVKSSDDAIIGKDLNGMITSWNLGAEKMFGYTAAEIVGTSILRLIPDGRQQEEQGILEKIRSGGSVEHFETLRQAKDGRLLDVSVTVSPIRNPDGSVVGVSKIARDITERKRAEKRIAKLGEELATIFNSAPTMIWYKDDKNNLYRVNPAAAKAMGMAVAEIEGRSAYDLLPGEAEHYYEDDREVLASGKPKLNIIERLQTSSGETRWVQTDKVPYRDETGSVIGVIVISTDITELIQAQEELSRKNAEIESFTNAVSHDLKSPLVTIKTFLGYLEQDLKANKAESVAKDLGFIHGAADKMERMLAELLQIARIGHQANPPVTAALQEIVNEVLDILAGQIAVGGVEVDVTEKPVWLTGDRDRLVEIFQNLVDNALKFLGDQPQPRIEIGAEQEGGEVVLFVRDNGKGIDPLHHDRVFGLFEKLDTHAPGSGLGLALVRRIVELHGGRIWVESEGLGHGATFRFTLANIFFSKADKMGADGTSPSSS